MRILKQKIAKALEYDKLQRLARLRALRRNASLNTPSSTQSSRQLRIKPRKSLSEASQCPVEKKKRAKGNNVMKNYARAMVNFGLSPLAEPYIERYNERSEKMESGRFRDILLGEKKNVNCIKSLRDLLLIMENDNEEMGVFKRLFQELCKIFMKFFSVNWIYNSKIMDKLKYLKYRGKITRRIQNPLKFTYLESFVEKKKSSRRGSPN